MQSTHAQYPHSPQIPSSRESNRSCGVSRTRSSPGRGRGSRPAASRRARARCAAPRRAASGSAVEREDVRPSTEIQCPGSPRTSRANASRRGAGPGTAPTCGTPRASRRPAPARPGRQVVDQVAATSSGGSAAATAAAARSRSRRCACSGQISASSQATSAGSVTSSGLRSRPARHTTSGTRGRRCHAGDRAVEDRRAGAEPVVAVAVGVPVGVEAEPGGRADLQQGERLRQRGEHRQQHRAPPGLVGLGGPDAQLRLDRRPVRHREVAERGRVVDRAAEEADDAEQQIRLPLGRRKRGRAGRGSPGPAATASDRRSYVGDTRGPRARRTRHTSQRSSPARSWHHRSRRRPGGAGPAHPSAAHRGHDPPGRRSRTGSGPFPRPHPGRRPPRPGRVRRGRRG